VYFFAVWAFAIAAWNKAIFPKSRLVMEVVSSWQLCWLRAAVIHPIKQQFVGGRVVAEIDLGTEERHLAFANARLGDRRAAVEILWGDLPERRLNEVASPSASATNASRVVSSWQWSSAVIRDWQ
jgi:hypothetical protein